jgi:NitT/TauT family transport system substrate-binding protein
MKKLLLALLLLTLTACVGAPTATPALPHTQTPSPLTHVKLAMVYIPDIQFAPFYVSAEKVYFAEQGIEIEFVTMFENDSVPILGANELQFANVSAEQIIQARAQGLPVIYVMKWWEKYTVAIVSKEANGIKTPADLKGRTVGLPGLYGASYVGLRALLRSQGIQESDLQLESIGFTQAEALAADQVEAAVVYANNEPIKLKAAGETLNVIYVAEYADLASNGLATNDPTIADHPELVRGMIAAILKGLSDTIADPSAAVEISKKYVETLANGDAATLDTARAVLAASIEMWQTPSPGVSDRTKWETTQNTLLDMGLIPSAIDLDQAFTNEFVK